MIEFATHHRILKLIFIAKTAKYICAESQKNLLNLLRCQEIAPTADRATVNRVMVE